MSLAVSYSRANFGVTAIRVSVETHLSGGLPSFTIVGLPETAVKESRDRVRSAIINSHFEFPSRRITVNLAPADLPKVGSRFDLAIAIGILAASGQIPAKQLEHYEFIGELALSGELRYVQGVLPSLLRADNDKTIILPSANHNDAVLPTNSETLLASHILEVSAHILGNQALPGTPEICEPATPPNLLDIRDVSGQPQAKLALEIAAAGGHNLLMVGPPGTGKTMLASRLIGLLPPLNKDAAIEVATLHSLAGKSIDREHWRQRPFRQPHHTASAIALVGGGSLPKPGEISLAHRGVLFLDELPEFDRKVLEVLREPLESGNITISRATQTLEFPARFQMIAAMNPCPCGFYGDSHQPCRCSPSQIQRYRSKVSGPLLDRIDLQVLLNRVPMHLLKEQAVNKSKQSVEGSDVIRRRVLRAHKVQYHRQRSLNALTDAKLLLDTANIEKEAVDWLGEAIEKLNQSARSFHRTLRIARTLADIEQVKSEHKEIALKVAIPHVKQALAFRMGNKD